MSGPTFNQPATPTYGESLADALKAQAEFLKGTGDFAETGSLESLLPLEESLRKKTAQLDTDVLRQTLLGTQQKVVQDPETGKFGIPGAEAVKSNDGQPQTAGGGRYQIIMTDSGRDYKKQGALRSKGVGRTPAVPGVSPTYTILDTETGGTTGSFNVPINNANEGQSALAKALKNATNQLDQLQNTIDTSGTSAVASKFNFTNPNTGEPLQQGEVVRAEDGMIDLLGDSRDVQGMRDMTREERLTAMIDRNPFFAQQYINSTNNPDSPFFGDTKAEFMAKRIEAVGGEQNLAKSLEMNKSVMTTSNYQDASDLDLVQDEQVFGSLGRQAGFDEQGNFLGLSALAEDIQRGNLSRQREADLADVERLAGRYSDVMEEFKPGTVSGLEGARKLLEEQKEAMTTGGGKIDLPTDDTFGGDVIAATMDAAEVADPLLLKANTQFQGELATGTGNQDTLRSALLGDARTALDSGLTDREQAQIANAARARQTLMGRTFDQSGAIAEAEARVAEDNARRMQNRAFAQSVLGQEAGLQQGDITRGMAQESEQAGLQQRADLTQAQMDQQANAFSADALQRSRMANKAQRQQANQFGVGAKMDAQRMNEQLRQQGLGNYIAAVGNLAQIEQQTGLDPFQALLGRGGGTALQQGQSVFGQAGYGLQSGPQYLNPEAGLGFISQMAANDANMYAANVAADASRSAGIFGGLGALGGGVLGGLSSAGKIF